MTGANKEQKILSVKSSDLLAIPSNFWRKVFENSADFANFIGGFQHAVAGGHFSMAQCPYPASAAVYVALRWYRKFDESPAMHWSVDHLNRIYRAFFWRNVLGSRYDQGFLTQIGADIRSMKELLNSVSVNESMDVWATRANTWLDDAVGQRPSLEEITGIVSNGNEKGALRRGALLLLFGRASQDPINPELAINLEAGSMDLHHIFPKDWCKNNQGGPLKALLAPDTKGGDWVNSAANLMPMHRSSNNDWRKSSPATFLTAREIDFDSSPEIWNRYFINRALFDLLLKGEGGVEAFWVGRAKSIAQELFDRTAV